MFERICRAWFDLAAVLLALAIVALPSRWLTDHFFFDQDLPVLVAILLAAGLCRLGVSLAGGGGSAQGSTLDSGGAPRFSGLVQPGLLIVALAALCAIVALAGAQLVYDGYALSLDEFMARFDGVILGHGAPLAPTPAAWRPFLSALQPQFVRATPDGAFWSSTYLPVNAALRAVAGLAGGAALVSPALSAVSVLAVFAVGRCLSPDRPRVALIAAILLATSSQFLITAMTSYAMTAHLAFNLVWLWLFLRGGRLGHAGALVVGFLACGLHQLVFHPLFVAPFVIQLGLERRWRVAALYAVAYAGICLFWIDYDALAWDWVGAGAHATTVGGALGPSLGVGGGSNGFAAEAMALLRVFDPAQIGLMAKNLVRFVTWQNLLTPPLVLAGGLAALRAKGTLRSLILGLMVTTAAMFIVLPYQGHGWGYRYLHGFLGSMCLLAAWTWAELTENIGAGQRRAMTDLFLAAGVVSAGILLPVRAIQTHAFVHPYAMADAEIRHAAVDVVLVDDRASLFTVDLVRNDSLLRNRPLVLKLAALNTDQIRALCAAHTIAVFDQADAARFGIEVFHEPAPTLAVVARQSLLRGAACGATRGPIRDLGGQPLP